MSLMTMITVLIIKIVMMMNTEHLTIVKLMYNEKYCVPYRCAKNSNFDDDDNNDFNDDIMI